jgi:hypothetical protein
MITAIGNPPIFTVTSIAEINDRFLQGFGLINQKMPKNGRFCPID